MVGSMSGRLESGAETAAQGTGHKASSGPLTPIVEGLGLMSEQTAWLGARDSFNLIGEDRVWLVLEGVLDLFICDRSLDSGGRRQPLLSLAAGGLCIGFCSNGDEQVLAVPRRGSRLLEARLDALIGLAEQERLRGPVATALDGWVYAVAAALSRPRAPANCRVLTGPGEIDIAEAESVQVDGMGVLWLAQTKAPVLVRGLCPVVPGRALAQPLTAERWVRSGADDRWLLRRTLDCLGDGGAIALHASIQGLQRCTIERLVVAAKEDRQLANRRAGAAQVSSRAELQQGISALAAVLEPGHRVPPIHATDPLIASVQVACRAMGIKQPALADLEPALASMDPLLMMARRLGFALRSVRLTDAWWTDDHGPIIARRKSTGQVVTLLPGAGGRYECVDPIATTVVPVDAGVSDQLEADARVLYRPLPEGQCRPLQILGFGLRGSWRDGLIAFALLLATGVLSLVTPILTGWILDPVIPQAQIGQLWTLTVAILVAGLSQQAFGLVQSLLLLRIEGRVANTVQSAVWERLLRLPVAFFNQFSAGDLANRAMSIDAMRQALSSSTIAAMTHTVVGIFSLGLMIYYNWRLALAAGIIVLIYAVIVIFGGRRVLLLNRVQLKLGGQLQGLILQLLGAVDKLRVTGSERHAFGRWADLYGRLQSNTFAQQIVNNRLVVFKSVFQIFATFSIIFVLGWQSGELLAFYRTPESWSEINDLQLQAVMPTGVFVAFYAAFGQFLGAAFGLSEQIIQFANIPTYYERVTPILSAEPETLDGIDPGEIKGDIEVQDLYFRYAADGPLVLHGLSLQARMGEFIAITGPSGAGKSSLVRLLLGFDVPESGSIYLDGQDIAALDKRSMRQNFGVVLQNGRLLAGTLLQNIIAGAQLTRDDAMEAARLAGLDQDIDRMPMGLDTYLSEGASTLSGGQRQRLMIARAVVRRPRVLIFDEATSALDNLTQSIVTESLERLNSTRIVIAHRLSTIRHADRIYVIDNGQVAEAGLYEELMANNGLFATMARRQVL